MTDGTRAEDAPTVVGATRARRPNTDEPTPFPDDLSFASSEDDYGTLDTTPAPHHPGPSQQTRVGLWVSSGLTFIALGAAAAYWMS